MLEAELLQKLGGYLFQHPDELLRVLRNITLLKFGVPLSALRWAAARGAANGRGGQSMPRDITLEAVPPGVRVGMSVELMGTPLRTSALVFVDGVQIGPEELLVELRVSEVQLSLLGVADSPLAALIRSGALDLGKIGNLVAVMPKRPPFLVKAEGDRIVLDLKRHRAFSGERLQQALSLITPLVTIKGVATDSEHLDLELDVLRSGVSGAVEAWKKSLRLPW